MNEIVKKILKKYYDQIPVPIIQIANDLGINVYNAEFDSDRISGSILKENGDFSIYVNKNEPSYRKRFTIAHELGHFIENKDILEKQGEHYDYKASKLNNSKVLFRFNSNVVLPSKEERLREIKANKFAANILMPEDNFFEAWKKHSSMQDIANEFDVSILAASIRAEKLGLSLT
ncbi:hypothetical protein CL633_02990 [bacterium]|nr:hypothetical protein [bacterium]|tara:strand:- start:2742 stop:3266 length:525 start_codon:yes stop_codon:yes gene_type:complete